MTKLVRQSKAAPPNVIQCGINCDPTLITDSDKVCICARKRPIGDFNP